MRSGAPLGEKEIPSPVPSFPSRNKGLVRPSSPLTGSQCRSGAVPGRTIGVLAPPRGRGRPGPFPIPRLADVSHIVPWSSLVSPREQRDPRRGHALVSCNRYVNSISVPRIRQDPVSPPSQKNHWRQGNTFQHQDSQPRRPQVTWHG